MGNMTVRRIDDEVIRGLRISAARRGVSMEQGARDRPLPRDERGPSEESADEKPKWRLKASMEEILALGRKPDVPIDHKAESDALYAYLERE